MRRRLVGRARAEDIEEEPVWMSLSDLMTALLAVFMLATVALVYSLAQKHDTLAEALEETEAAKQRSDQFDVMLTELSGREQARIGMVSEIGIELASQGIEVEIDETRSVLSIPVEVLGFESGSSAIDSQFEPTALALGEVIASVLIEDEKYKGLDTVFVEGHTDDIPMEGLHGGNWGLSTNRAISLWRLWEDRLSIDLGSLQGHSGEPLFSVSGYSDTRPINAVQKTDADRSVNRRIDIRFTEHRLTEEEINEVRGSPTVSAETP